MKQYGKYILAGILALAIILPIIIALIFKF